MSRKTGILILVALLVLLAGGYYYQSRTTSTASSAAAPPKRKQDRPRPVHVIEVQRGAISQQTTASGDILAAAKVEVFSKVEGRLSDLHAEQGDAVRQGHVIAQIADDELEARTERAAAELEALQADWAQMQAGERPEEIAQALDRVQSTQAALVNARRDLQRAQALYDRGLYSTQQLDDATLKTTQSRAAHAVAQKQLRMLRTGARVEDRQALQARMRAAEAALRLAKTQLRHAVITAPMTGIVSHRHVDPGAYMTDRTALVTIVDMQSVKIKVPISERDIGQIRPGLAAHMRVDAYPQAVFTGAVKRMSPTIDPANRSADVEIIVANDDGRLKPGMFAKVTLMLQQRHEVLLAPRQAIRREGDIASVFVVQEGTAHVRQITTGLQNETQVEILDGLDAGMMIILAGHHQLKDQTPVTVVRQPEGS